MRGESGLMRDRYGRTKFGQSILLARRLVEAGVSLVRVNWSRVPGVLNAGTGYAQPEYEWTQQLMPIMDAAYATLLDDLSQRGLLDETLVSGWPNSAARRASTAAPAATTGPRVLRRACWRRHPRRHGPWRFRQHRRLSARRPRHAAGFARHHLPLSGTPIRCEYQDALGRPIPLSRGDVIRRIV